MNENLATLFSFPTPSKTVGAIGPSSVFLDDPLTAILNEGPPFDEHMQTEGAPPMEFNPVKEPKFLSRHELIEYMQTQLGLLREATARLNYYSEEIEAYLPQK